MEAVRYRAPRSFEVGPVPDPAVGPEDVLVEVYANGVCHTDVNVHEGEFFAAFPLIPGHETVGRVARTGSQVPLTYAAGMRVVVENASTCGRCPACRRGQHLFCERFYSLGINGPGGAAEFEVVPWSQLLPLPDHVGVEEAVLTEPLACAVHGIDAAGVRLGERVLIVGAGPSGQLLGQLARLSDAGRIVVAAPSRAKLDLARRHFADAVVVIPRDRFGDAGEAIRDEAPSGYDLVIDTTGSPAVLQELFSYLANQGRLLIYGMARFEDRATFVPYDVFRRELRILGSFAQIHEMGRALELIASGRIDVAGLVTHRFPLKGYGEALETVIRGRGIKTILRPGLEAGEVLAPNPAP